MVDLVDNAIDYGDAPTIVVTGCCRIDRSSPGIATFSFYRERRESSGTIERRIVVELVCDALTAPADPGASSVRSAS
jgi:hypothetical protein